MANFSTFNTDPLHKSQFNRFNIQTLISLAKLQFDVETPNFIQNLQFHE